MIQFLEYSAGGKRGGELFTGRLHAALKRKFQVEPDPLPMRPKDLRNPLKQLVHSLKLVKKATPRLIIVDVSSGIRNAPAIRWAKNHDIGVLTIIQEKRMNFRFRNFFLVRFLVRRFEHYSLSKADIILTNSRFMADFARKKCGRDIPVIISYPGVNIGPLDGSELIRKRDESAIRLLLIGECTERKGIEYILRGLPGLKDFDVKLDIAGSFTESDPYYKKLLSMIEEFGLENKVQFLGFLNRQQLQDALLRCRIYVQPSLSEGYGIAMAEALAYGLPVVATRVAAIPEMIEDGVNGILVPPRDPRALADAIRRLLTDTELWDRIHDNNLAKARTLPTWDDFDRTLERELVPAIERLTGVKPTRP